MARYRSSIARSVKPILIVKNDDVDWKKEARKQSCALNKKLSRMSLYELSKFRIHPPKVVIICPVRKGDIGIKSMTQLYGGMVNLKIMFVVLDWGIVWNKGALMNIGFLELRKMYPFNFETINIVFHNDDVKPYITFPKKSLVSCFTTERNKILHNFWDDDDDLLLKFAFTINALDFQKTEGFSNVYGYGSIDKLFTDKVKQCGFEIMRCCKKKKMSLKMGSDSIEYNKYSILFKSEYERKGKEIDNFNETNLSYVVEFEGNDIVVKSLSTKHSVSLESSNIRICSKVPLCPKQLLHDFSSKQNIMLETGLFVNKYDPCIHCRVL